MHVPTHGLDFVCIFPQVKCAVDVGQFELIYSKHMKKTLPRGSGYGRPLSHVPILLTCVETVSERATTTVYRQSP